MTALEAYKRFLLKVNKFDSNDEIRISKGEFVILFNDEAKRWLNAKIGKYNNNSDIVNLLSLLVYDLPLQKIGDFNVYSSFALPDNFFTFNDCKALVRKNGCTPIKYIYTRLINPKDSSTLYHDEFSSPSYEWEETFADIANKRINIYTKNFTAESVKISYYKNPEDIDIEGYKRIDGSNSTTINPTLEDVYVNEIINRCVLEALRNYSSLEAYQASLERIQSEE